MSAYQRRKGAAGEREFINDVLKPAGYRTAARQLGQARDGGGDVIVDGVLYEVKRRAKLAVREFMDQAEKAAYDAEKSRPLMPVVVMREDGRTDWLVMLRADDYFRLLRSTKQMGHSLPNTTNLKGLL
ncbi:MAG: hypothetical protein ACREIB_01390 [Pseudomonadota bacterium]